MDTAKLLDELPALSNHGHAASVEAEPESQFNGPQFINPHWANATLRQVDLWLQQSRTSGEHGLYDLEVNSVCYIRPVQVSPRSLNRYVSHTTPLKQYHGRLSCIMWQRSYFYDKALLATHGWHLRWFTFTPDSMYSVPYRAHAEKHRMPSPVFTLIDLDERRLIVRIFNPDPQKRSYYLMVPSQEIFVAACAKMEALMELRDEGDGDELFHLVGTQQAGQGGDSVEEALAFESSDEEGCTLIDFPAGAGSIEIFFFSFLVSLPPPPAAAV